MIKSEIQMVRSLGGDKQMREQMGLFVAEGDKFIGELICSPLKVRKIYLREGSTLDASDYPREVAVEWVSGAEMDRISQLKSANNSLALVEIPRRELQLEELERGLTIVLDGVQNPGNMGTIIRLADWFGVHNIICSPTCADSFNPKVVQATMGAILRVQTHYTPLQPLLEEAKKRGIAICGAMLEGDNIYDKQLPQCAILVMGSEGQGVSPEVERYIDQRLYIPSFSRANEGSESLNVAIATAIICSEFKRRG